METTPHLTSFRVEEWQRTGRGKVEAKQKVCRGKVEAKQNANTQYTDIYTNSCRGKQLKQLAKAKNYHIMLKPNALNASKLGDDVHQHLYN